MNKFSFLILVSFKAFGKCELAADASTDITKSSVLLFCFEYYVKGLPNWMIFVITVSISVVPHVFTVQR